MVCASSKEVAIRSHSDCWISSKHSMYETLEVAILAHLGLSWLIMIAAAIWKHKKPFPDEIKEFSQWKRKENCHNVGFRFKSWQGLLKRPLMSSPHYLENRQKSRFTGTLLC